MAETPFLNFFGGEFDPESGRFRDKQGRFVPAPPQTSEPTPTDAEAEMKNKQAAEDVQDIKQNTEDAAQALFDFAKERERDKQKEKREKQKAKRGEGTPSADGEDEKDKNFLQLFAGEFVGDFKGIVRGLLSSIPVADQALRAFDKLRKQNKKKDAGGVEGGVEDAPLEEAGVLSDGELDEIADAEPKPVEGNLVEVLLEIRNIHALLYHATGSIIEIDKKFAELLAHLTDQPLEDVETEREERRQGKIPKQETPELEELFDDDDKEGGILGDLLSGGVAGLVSRFLPAIVTAMTGSTVVAGLATIAVALLGAAAVGLAIRALINAISEGQAEKSQRERDTQTVDTKPVTNEEGEKMFIVTKDGEEMVVPESKLTADNFTQEELESARPVSQTVDPDTGQPLAGPSTIEEGPMPDALAETPQAQGGSARPHGGILANLSRMEYDIMQNTLSHLRGGIDDKTAGDSLLHLYKQYKDLLDRQSDDFKDAYPEIYKSSKNIFFRQAKKLRGAMSLPARASFGRNPAGGFTNRGHDIHRAILDGKSDIINTSGAAGEMGRKLIQASDKPYIRPKERKRETTISVPVEMAPTFADQATPVVSSNASATPVLPSPDGGFVEPNPNDTVSADAIRAGAEMEFASASVSPTTGGGILMNQVDASESTTNQTYVDANGTETHTQHAAYRDAANGNRGNLYT